MIPTRDAPGAATVRTFIALRPSAAQRDAIADAVRRARAAAPHRARPFRWADPATLHLTLAFLGEVPRDRTDDLTRILSDVASRHAPFRWAFGDAGGFPGPERVRVAWIGLREGSDPTRALAADLAAALTAAGWSLDGRPFHAHLTVARVRGTPAPHLPIDAAPTPAAIVSEIVLMASELRADGARHEAIARRPLGRAAEGRP